MTQTTDETPALPDWLPEEALEAIRTGGEWDGMPDSAGDCSTWYTQDDDGEWRGYWHPMGHVVEGGKLYLRVMTCDSDGNWDFEDEAEVGAPEEAQLETIYGYDAWLKNYHEYLEWVAEHGEDPCGEFLLSPVITEEQQWRAQCLDSAEGVILARAKREGKVAWIRPANLPKEIIQFLNARLEKQHWIMGDFARLADLEKLVAESQDLKRHRVAGGGIAVSFDVKVSRPNRRYRAEVIAAAKRALKPVKVAK